MRHPVEHRQPATPTSDAPRPRGRAFTLIELVVVVVIIAIAAAAIAPRMARDDGRKAEASATALREVLSAAATRADLTGSRVALTYDAKDRTVRVMEFRWAGPPTDWDAGGTWEEDSLIPGAVLEESGLSSVRADEFAVDPSRWTIEFAPGQRRPSVSIVVAQDKSDRAWRIDLPSGSLRAEMSGAGAPTGTVTTQDLDAEGRSEESW